MDLAQRMTRVAIRPRRRLAIAMVAAAFVTTACSGSAATPSTASVAASHPSNAPTAAADPSSTISSTAPSLQPSARAEPTTIPDGTYTAIATREDALRIPWDDDCALKQEGAHITLELASGEWTQSESCKTVPDSVGAQGTYTSTADTLVMRDCCDGSASTFTWTLDGTKLTLRLRGIDGGDESATGVTRFIFEHEFDTAH